MNTVYQGVGIGWKVKKEEACVQCSLISEPTIFIEQIPRHKIELLMTKYPSQEWLGYLVGKQSEKGNYFVEDLVIPPHKEAYGACAEAEPFYIPDKCIGVIHSHHSMGAFHSQTDKDYVDKNFPVSITVAKQGNISYDAVSYQTTECGRETTSKGTVKYVAPAPSFDTTTFMKEAVGNIDKGKKVYGVQIHYPATTPRLLGRGTGTWEEDLPYSGHKDYVLDDKGHPMSQKELAAHLKEIWGD